MAVCAAYCELLNRGVPHTHTNPKKSAPNYRAHIPTHLKTLDKNNVSRAHRFYRVGTVISV